MGEDLKIDKIDLKTKIDKLIELGYTFDFLSAGDAMGRQSPSVIQVSYGCKDKEFIEIINRYFNNESCSVVAECRRYIQGLSK